MRAFFKLVALASTPLIAACVSMPSGPSQMSLPGTGKSFDQFRADDYQCQQFASSRLGGKTPNEAAADSGVASTLIGAAVGAAAGAAIKVWRTSGRVGAEAAATKKSLEEFVASVDVVAAGLGN